jgi:hypothetical protein
MKTKWLTIAISLSLLAIMAGAVFLSTQGQDPVGASIKYNPNRIVWDGPAANPWQATIRAAAGYDWNPRDIDTSMPILFEYTVPSIGGYYISGGYVALFDGYAFHNVLIGRVGHMTPDGTLKYYFTVSGYLKDGTPFAGQGWIRIEFPAPTAPPLPPP